MRNPTPSITVAVDPTNPGQFFACCGLLELASRLDEESEGWFDNTSFQLRSHSSFGDLIGGLRNAKVTNTMSVAQNDRLKELSVLLRELKAKRKTTQQAEEKKKIDQAIEKVENEKKSLDTLRREEPIIFRSSFQLRIDWFKDKYSGGSRFKTWAGQQSVLDIATAMHAGVSDVNAADKSTLWNSARGGGLPFNFDSDLGGQGSALDIGFSFDPLAASETTRIEGSCKPSLEVLAFIGLQRFRPREIPLQNRFVYVAWRQPLSASVAAAVVCQAVEIGDFPAYQFRLLYRTDYLKSFLPAIPFQGEDNE